MSLLSKIVKKNAGGIKSVVGAVAKIGGGVIGGPAGAIAAGALTAALGGSKGGGGGKPPVFTGSGPGLDFGDIGDAIRRVAPGGKTGRGRVALDSTGRCPSGYHPAKDGRGCVRNRRMNPANGRALKRAVRRAKAFKKMANKLESLFPKQRRAVRHHHHKD